MASRGLQSSRQFRLVYSTGKREAGSRVIVYYLKREDGGVVPGFVASKKIGKACRRNRAKRLMREIFKRLEGCITERNLWIVFIASFNPKESTFNEIYADVERSLTRAGILISNG
mgnify:FL=1